MASVYPSAQWSVLERGKIPLAAASDIVQGAAVCVASAGDWSVIMCTSSAQKPIGVANDYAIAGNPVAVRDDGNIVRTNVGGNGAGASFSRQSYLGVVGTSTMVHPQSGVTVTFGYYGTVAANGSAIGGANTSVWAVGVAYESAATGDFAAFRVEPRLLAGAVTP